MTSEPESYKVCRKCKEEYVDNEKEEFKNKIIKRHNRKCPNCKHNKEAVKW